MNAKTIAPRDCNNDQICAIESDHADVRDFWILSDGYSVSICEQKPGKKPTQEITVPVKIFNKLIDWYLKPQAIDESLLPKGKK